MSVAEVWKNWQSRRALACELNSLDLRQREELAHDVGITEFVFERLYKKGGRTGELERLMYVLSLGAEKIGFIYPGVARDMSRVCSECSMTSRCLRELNAGSAGRNYKEYCPNAPTLDALLKEQIRSERASWQVSRV
jgi:hypothetical protein